MWETVRVDGAGFLAAAAAAAASAECPMSTTFLPVWLKDLIFSYVLQLPKLVSGVVRQGCAGRAAAYKSTQRSGGQNNNNRGR
jgi:hypothetical protein